MVTTRSASDSDRVAPVLALGEALSLPALTLLCEKLNAARLFKKEHARLAAALQEAQIPEGSVKLLSYVEEMPSAGDGEVNFYISAAFDITRTPAERDVGESNKLGVRYQYWCEDGMSTNIVVSYGSATGSGNLTQQDRKGHTGSCSSDGFRDVMEQVALDLGMVEELSSQDEKDARAPYATKYCADEIDSYGFPAWTEAEKRLIKVMEMFVPAGGLHKLGLDLSFLGIVMRELADKDWQC